MRPSDTEKRGCIQAVDWEWSLAQPHFHGWVVWDQVNWLTAQTLPGTNSQAGQTARFPCLKTYTGTFNLIRNYPL